MDTLSHSIDTFWTWFKKNEKSLRNFENNHEQILDAIFTEGKKIQDGIVFELQPPQNGIIMMTVSADGIRKSFPVVENIVAQAPKIEGWHFIAFRQRIPIEEVKHMVLEIGGYQLDPTKMKFSPIVSQDIVDMIIYADGITEDNYKQVAYGTFLLMDHLLGEYDCVTKVRNYDFHAMPVDHEKLNQLKPLLEMAEYIDDFYKSKK